MSRDMIVIAFDTEDKADEVLHSIKSAQKGGFINLEDTVVVRKDADGKVHSRNAVDKTTKEGVAVGGLIGLFLGFLFAGPIGAMLVGGVGGGVVGALMGKGVDNKFIKDVSEAIQPNTSALFLVVRSAQADVALAALRQYEGKIIQSSLPEDVEESLERALSGKKPLPATGENAPKHEDDT
ncbi:MAG: DUF1269 domain-containing protein [Chloroflexi bacterium]|nr:DUF1269 domain-containing protein [Chloroflexota bacterium]